MRFAVPAEWREVLGAPDAPVHLIMTERNGVRMIKVMGLEAIEARFRQIDRLKAPDGLEAPAAIKRKIRARLFCSLREASVNSQGKLQLPRDLCEAVGVSGGASVDLLLYHDSIEILAADPSRPLGERRGADGRRGMIGDD
jgi:DNA-binding transcriptional regulator/RsmH inhibitor MraZ